MKPAILTAFGLCLLAGPSQGQSVDPSGTYLSECGETRLRISQCGQGYCGTVVDEKDANAPSAGLRALAGIQIIPNVQPPGSGFTARLYDFKDDTTYACDISFKDARTMQLSGCALDSLICRSQTWRKVN